MAALAASVVFVALLLVGVSAGPAPAEFAHDHVVCRGFVASDTNAILSDPRLLDRLCGATGTGAWSGEPLDELEAALEKALAAAAKKP